MSSPATFETFQQELTHLVDRFSAGAADFLSRQYDEASLRQDFLNPLFRSLGWDLENTARLILKHREVEIESRTMIAGRKKRADYLFRTTGSDRFVCEAKKPSQSLDSRDAFQAKRYGWNKAVPLALLSDFEELCIYIVAARPAARDDVEIGRWKKWHYTEYPAHAREIWDLLSRDAVASGSIDRLLDTLPKKPAGKGRARQLWLIRPDRSRALDTDFLNFLDEARRTLGSDLLRHNPTSGLREDHARLNAAVQCILDRILFLRICEDRDIDTGTNLQLEVENWRSANGLPSPSRARQSFLPAVGEEPPPPSGSPTLSTRELWPSLVDHFRALDRRPASHVPYFNGHLFKPHFIEELTVGDAWLSTFLEDLSSDESPYLFAVIPVEILGTIYERFLGKVIRPQGLGVTIEEKPEVRKAGGVYYTPSYIVDYIVEQTVGKLLADKHPEKTLALRLLDPACGSGSFLIRVFERVCDHWLTWLTANPKSHKKTLCWTDPATGDVHLTAALKRRILTANIYGVDLDPGAVEVTQLSLYLKMLEGENRNTLSRERELFTGEDEPALLPPLAANIKRGNSLIASDFSLDPDELLRVHAFDWDVQFSAIMKAGGFDAVVGNPPYIRIQGFPKAQVEYFVKQYVSATGNYDIYVNFVERSLHLLSSSGRVGMILPNKFFRTDYGTGLRELLASNQSVTRIVDFGAAQVFDATTYTCLLFIQKNGAKTFEFASSQADASTLASVSVTSRPSAALGKDAWTFSNENESNLIKKLVSQSSRLLDLPADMSRGSSSGDDEIFMVGPGDLRRDSGVLRTPLFASDFGRYFFAPETKWKIIFPYCNNGGEFQLLPAARFKSEFPEAFSHLQNHAEKLKQRKQFKEWFGYSAPRNLALHDRAQIAVPLLANSGVFSLIPKKTRGYICPMASGGFTITLGADCPYSPEFVLGLLNSKLLFWRLRSLSNVFRGGWITCTKQYFGELPIISLDLKKSRDRDRHDNLVTLVEKMLALTPKLRAATDDHERATLQNALTATDNQIDQLVYQLYELTPEEIALVEAATAPPVKTASVETDLAD